jgi:cob(I)alamin adenosyltransferase
MTDAAQRHKARMQRKKALVDSAIARASEERGIMMVLTGNGKGKSSSAFGMAARALGHQQRIGVIQFIKGGEASGEQLFLAQQANVIWHCMGTGFTWETQDRDKDIAAAETLWQKAEAMLIDPKLDMVILDELTYMFQLGYLDWAQVKPVLCQRPEAQNLIITGRGARPELLDLADTVSEIKDIKHAFRAGIKARPGVEY